MRKRSDAWAPSTFLKAVHGQIFSVSKPHLKNNRLCDLEFSTRKPGATYLQCGGPYGSIEEKSSRFEVPRRYGRADIRESAFYHKH